MGINFDPKAMVHTTKGTINIRRASTTRSSIFPQINSNGKLDHGFVQGSKNDCYLLVSLLALYDNPHGKKYIKNNLKRNPDGSITVCLPGIKQINEEAKNIKSSYSIPESYTITPEEVAKAHNFSYSYRLGGGEWEDDVILYELAFEKYRKYVMENPLLNKTCSGGEIGKATAQNPLNFGKINDAMFLITGKMGVEHVKSNKNTHDFELYDQTEIKLQTEKATKQQLNKILDKYMKNKDRYALGAGINNHGYQIVSVTEDEVVLRDPEKSKPNPPISREKFLEQVYSITVWDAKSDMYSGFWSHLKDYL